MPVITNYHPQHSCYQGGGKRKLFMETEAVFVPGCKYALNVFKLGMSPWESVEVGSLSD